MVTLASSVSPSHGEETGSITGSAMGDGTEKSVGSAGFGSNGAGTCSGALAGAREAPHSPQNRPPGGA
jgi:hypothetical protein